MSNKELTPDNLVAVADEVNESLRTLNSIMAIKTVRDYTGLSLYDSKKIVDEVKDAAPIGSFFHDARRADIIIDKLRPHAKDNKPLVSEQLWNVMLAIEAARDNMFLEDDKTKLMDAFTKVTEVWAQYRFDGL